jgi:oligopeptide transport system substrate-binding protein
MRTAALFLASIFSFGGCTCAESPRGREAHSLRVQLATEPVSLDPALAEDGASLRVINNVMDGLVGYDGEGKLVNRLAASYRVLEGGLKYEFTLREDANWSDGRPVIGDDFVTAFKRSLDPSTSSKLASSLLPIRGAREFRSGRAQAAALGIRADGAKKLIIELERPTPYFIQALTVPPALPLRADVLAENGGTWPPTAPSTGPYRITKYLLDRTILLTKNPRYCCAPVPIKDVELVLVGDDSTAVSLFEQGRLDVLTRIPQLDQKRMRERGLLRVDPFLATYYISFNLSKPPFSNRDWRRAVAATIRRDELVAALATGETPARSWVARGLEGYVEYSDPSSVFADSLERVRTLAPPRGVINAAFDSGSRNAMIMEKVQADVKRALGLKLSLSNLDWKTFVRTIQVEPPQIFRFGWLAPFDDPFPHLQMFTTGDPNNIPRFSNAEYDALVREIEVMSTGPARVEKIQQAQEILVDREAVVIPLYHYVQATVVSARVKNYRINPFGVIRFEELELK